MSSDLTPGSGVGVTGRADACGGVSGEGATEGCAAEEAKIASRLLTAALTDASRPFFTKADRYSSKARSDCRTGEDESYIKRSELLLQNTVRYNIRIRKAFPILK